MVSAPRAAPMVIPPMENMTVLSISYSNPPSAPVIPERAPDEYDIPSTALSKNTPWALCGDGVVGGLAVDGALLLPPPPQAERAIVARNAMQGILNRDCNLYSIVDLLLCKKTKSCTASLINRRNDKAVNVTAYLPNRGHPPTNSSTITLVDPPLF
jgi:hypothetical protein